LRKQAQRRPRADQRKQPSRSARTHHLLHEPCGALSAHLAARTCHRAGALRHKASSHKAGGCDTLCRASPALCIDAIHRSVKRPPRGGDQGFAQRSARQPLQKQVQPPPAGHLPQGGRARGAARVRGAWQTVLWQGARPWAPRGRPVCKCWMAQARGARPCRRPVAAARLPARPRPKRGP